MLVGAVIVQIFVQLRRHRVFHGFIDGIGREPRAHAFAETGSATAILPRTVTCLSYRGARRDAPDRALSYRRVLQTLAIRMTLLCSALYDSCGEEHQQREYESSPHVSDTRTPGAEAGLSCESARPN